MNIIETLSEMLSFAFIIRALFAGIAISISAAILGVILVLKRYAMIGEGLSCVSFGSMAIALAVGWAPVGFAVPSVLIAAFFLLRMSQHSKVNADAQIALISSTAIALGITVIHLNQGLNANIQSYMFGSILATRLSDVWWSVGLATLVILIFILFYQQIFTITFDESFSRATGVRVELFTGILAALTAVTIVFGMRLMGTILISSLVVFPAISAMQLFKTFKPVVISAAIISAVAFFLGIVLSWIFALPPGGAVVLVHAGIFVLFAFGNLVMRR